MFVIPMAGLSSRFFKAGFEVPKYQLSIADTIVFDLAIKSFERYFSTDLFLLIVRDVYDTPRFVAERLTRLGVRNFMIHTLDGETAGQAETVALGLGLGLGLELGNASIDDDEPIYIFNIDTFRYGFEKPDWVESVDGYLEVFEGEGDHWSFIAVDDDDRVIKTTEKQRISNLCSDGLYYFKSKQQYLSLFQQAVAQQLTVNNEYYIAPMYNLLIAQGGRIGYVKITEDDIDFCGTPDEYQALKAHGLKVDV